MATVKQLRKQISGASGFSQSFHVTRSLLRRHLWVWPVLAALVLGGIGWWVNRSVEQAMREELAGQLKTILNADVEALRTWTRDQQAIAQSVAQMPSLRRAVQDFLAALKGQDAGAKSLSASKELAKCRSLLRPSLESFGYYHFYLITPDMWVVGSDQDELPKSALEGYQRGFTQKVLDNGPALSMPVRSILPLPDAKGEMKPGLPTMFVAAPLRDEAGKSFAALVFRLRPEKEFSDILKTARFSESGETYAFSETGLLLSESRFDNDLKRLGLLPDVADAQSILTVEVRDPGVNMMAGGRPAKTRADQPLTKLVSKAVSEGGGVVMEPYGDYRGVPSVGACHWLKDEGFGVATEVDTADAFRPLYVLRRMIGSLFALLLLCAGGMFVFMVVAARQQRRVEKAERAVRQLGQYTLEQKIGSGGMGSVYRARHAFLRRPTAVKMLNADNVTNDSLARFEREVQLTSRLFHPNTIAVYDYGRTAEGTFYYAMEYLEGINLEELVSGWGPVPEARLVPILRQICGSLAEAHEIGLIHRDIKPANIILTCRAGLPDFVKVLDFGLVKAANAEEAAKLTQANVTVGTPYYMSPEAVQDPESVSPLSDVYAIGAVAYFLVTGTQVFTGKTVMEICMKQVRKEPDPPSARLGRPMTAGLESLILRCLAKKPEERPAGTRAMAEELEHLDMQGSWTQAEATAWWASFKKTPGSSADHLTTAADAEAEAGMPTVAAPKLTRE